MSATVKNAIMKGLVEGAIVELMVKTSVANVFLPDGTTLASKLAEIVTSINDINTEIDSLPTSSNVDEKIQTAIDALIDGAPATYDTLKEISDYLATHQDEYTALVQTVAGKVDKVDGMGLSHEDFTAELKAKLDGIAASANNYTLPAATASTLGGVKIGSNITNSSGTISVNKKNVTDALGYTPATQDVATTTTAGLMSADDKKSLDAKPEIYIQESQPANLKAGDIWLQLVSDAE